MKREKSLFQKKYNECVNVDISSQASSILRVFGYEDLYKFYNEIHILLEVWRIDENENTALFDEPRGDEDLIKLLRSAIVLSKISDLYGKKFDKISHRYWNFWKKCDEIAQHISTTP